MYIGFKTAKKLVKKKNNVLNINSDFNSSKKFIPGLSSPFNETNVSPIEITFYTNFLTKFGVFNSCCKLMKKLIIQRKLTW